MDSPEQQVIIPTITVIVATYDRPTYLKRALLSVLAQTYRDFECIVVHDGREEDKLAATMEALKEISPLFAEADLPLQLIATEQHTGYYTHPRNYATYHATGAYIANLDDDNEWTPGHLEGLIAAIEEGENWPDFVYSRRNYVLDEGAPKEFGGQPMPEGPSPLVLWDSTAIARLNAGPEYNFVDSSDFLIGKGPLYNLGITTGKIWNPNWRRFGDWEIMWRGINYAGWRGKAVDQITHNYHLHGKNVQLTRPVSEGYQEMKA